MLDVWPQPKNAVHLKLAETPQNFLLQKLFASEKQRKGRVQSDDGQPIVPSNVMMAGWMVVVLSHVFAVHLLISTRLADVLVFARRRPSFRSVLLGLLLYCWAVRAYYS